MLTYLDQLEAQASAKGLSLQGACIACGLPDSTYWRWKTGRTEGPSLKVARRVEATIAGMAVMWPIGDLDDYKTMIANLARVRKSQNISQLALDHRLGNPDGLVAKWECGDRRATSYNLACWASSLGVRVTLSGSPSLVRSASEVRPALA
jgi:hypothetical protein